MRKQNKKIAVGVLWIFSGVIILIAVVLLNLLLRFVFNANDGPIESILNIISWLLGVAGVLLIVAGPIIGVIVLAKKSQ